eukprot:gene12180-29263_t
MNYSSVALLLVLSMWGSEAAQYKWCQCDEWGTIQDLEIRDDHVCNEWDWEGVDCEGLRVQLVPLFTNFTFGTCNHGFERNKYGLGPDAVVCCYDSAQDTWLGGDNCKKPPSVESSSFSLGPGVMPAVISVLASVAAAVLA